MRKLALTGVALGALAVFSPDTSHAIRVWSNSTQQFLDINFLIETWFRYQKIDDKNRPNFIKAPKSNFDTSFRRIRLRMGGSYSKYFKFNFVMRLNNTGRDAYVAPFGGQPQGYIRQGELLGGRNFALHELDLKFALHEAFGTKGWIIDAHLGFPRLPLGREQYGRTGFDNLESDRTFATLRWTHLTVANVTGRAYGGFIHVRKGNKAKGFKKITWDGFAGVFDGFKGVEQPWDITVQGTSTSPNNFCSAPAPAPFAKCLSQLRSNSKDSFLYTFRTTLMLGKPEGKPKGLNWLYRDTYLGKRKGVTLGLSYAMQNDIDQELITDTQGPAPGVNGAGVATAGAGSVQVRVPYMILPNPFTAPQIINNPVDMQMYGVDLALHYGPLTLIGEMGQHQFKSVWLDPTNTDVSFKNKWLIVKGAWLINPGATHLWEPYISYYEWDPDIKENASGVAFGDAANFIGPGVRGKDRSTLGKIKVTSIGINHWYDKGKLFGWTFEYQMYDEERNEIDNDAFTIQFRFVF